MENSVNASLGTNSPITFDAGAKTLFDAELGHELAGGLRLSVGGENVFTTFPDENRKAANTNFGRFRYNRNVSQFGWNGGFYYTKLRLTLFSAVSVLMGGFSRGSAVGRAEHGGVGFGGPGCRYTTLHGSSAHFPTALHQH